MSNTTAELLEHALPTPATSISISKDAGPGSPLSHKRKRDVDETTEVNFGNINIRPYPGSIYDKPFLLRPLRIVPRARLPLSFLDTSAADATLSATRLFTAHIDALENEKEERPEALVLIASLGDGSELYAIERVKSRVYALCKLCLWVQIGYIEDGAAVTFQQVASTARKDSGEKWWHVAAVGPQVNNVDGTPVKRLKLSMAPPTVQSDAVPTEIVKTPAAPLAAEGSFATEEAILNPPADAPKPNEEVFENLIRQYLEALYISKTSLAFFAKGPLSRARNAFLTSTNATAISDFTSQLRAMLLTMAAMDKKYKHKLPEAIKSFPAQSLSDDEVDAPTTIKKRKSKKVPKLSREGYYPIEEDYCKRWWLHNQSSSARARPNETFDQLLRRRIGDLRRRETLAQIVLILEILALESLPNFKTAEVQTEESQPGETQIEPSLDSHLIEGSGSKASKMPKSKVKKQQDLDLLLDLLLDKLSIWQSIEQDLGATMDVDKKRDNVVENNEKLQEHDILVGFCTDVVLPFYKSRILKQASEVNKKLGGPGATSPGKAISRDAEKSRAKTRDRRRRPMQKTLSDTNGFIRSRPPSLSRSATDIQGMPRLKREASELSLFDIPAARPSHRDSQSQLRHLQQRQVDLTAISAATDAKVRQKAKVEQDLKAAINTLKRPNRGQAVRELADAADQRSLGSASMRKKTMGPVRKILQNVRNVQVTATPKHKRGFNAIAMAKVEQEEDTEVQHAPSSGDFCVPSSGHRSLNIDLVGATPAVSRVQPLDGPFAISATPSRKTLSSVPDGDLGPDELGATPLKNLATTLELGSSKPRQPAPQQGLSFQDFMRSQISRSKAPVTPVKSSAKKVVVAAGPSTSAAIFATPAEPSSTRPASLDYMTEITPLKAATAVLVANHEVEGQSIYDALGWNDYDDELA